MNYLTFLTLEIKVNGGGEGWLFLFKLRVTPPPLTKALFDPILYNYKACKQTAM